MATTMQTIVFARYGPAEVLTAQRCPIPQPGPTDVQVKIVAAGVNPADTALRQGTFRWVLRLRLPFVPGSDLAGVVTAVGDAVEVFRPGDPVYAMSPTRQGGTYAEYIVLDQALLAPMPPRLTFSQSAGVPLAALTALQALRDKAAVPADQRVLIYGASGGVGTFAVQIARLLGAEVTAACSTRNLALVEDLGAAQVIDYTRQALGENYDLILDAVARLPLSRGLSLTRPGGTFVSLNPGLGNPLAMLWARGRKRHLRSVFVQPNQVDLHQLGTWIETGQLRPVIDRTYNLTDAAAAHRYSESRRARGKLILHVDPNLAEQTAAALARREISG